MNDLQLEPIKIMNYLNFKYLIKNQDAIDAVHEAILKATTVHNPSKGALSTIKMTYARNALRDFLRKTKGPKYVFLSEMKRIVQGEATDSKPLKPNEVREARIGFDKDNHSDFYGHELVKVIKKLKSVSDRDKNILFDRLMHQMRIEDITKKYHLTRARVYNIIHDTKALIQRVTDQEEFYAK